MIEDKFKILIDGYNEEIKLYKKIYDRIGYLRLLTIIGCSYFTYKIIRGQVIEKNIYLSLLFFVFFVGLVIYHGLVKEKINISENMIDINKRYIDRISGEWTKFKDIGEEFINKNHHYSFDLDIVGPESLFQLINTTSTWKGRQHLAKILLNPICDKEEIILRQQAIEELYNKLELCEIMEHQGKIKKNVMENPKKLLAYFKEESTLIKSKILKRILYFMPMITVPVSILIIVFKLEKLFWVITVFLIIQLLSWAITLLRINNIFGAVNYFKGALDSYVKILKLLETEEFNSIKLKDISNRLFQKKNSSTKAIKELTRITEKIDIRNNGLFFIILNILFLWDFQCVFSIENWKKKYADNIEGWLDDIGEIEALMSISVLNHINEVWAFPEIVSEPTVIEANDLGHPLIARDARITNNINMKDCIFIITGSNMSGKTTLLRTIGINLVISYSGGAICGEYMRSSMVNIYTSMRITDDLKAGISTFYGELIRIKEIIEGAKRGEKMIFLIDEIFRGTNSRDRIEGATAVIGNLCKDGVVGALTTHDLELCTLAKTKEIQNYHFREHYKENKIYFDYKLRKGKSDTTNAKYLMKIVGIDLNYSKFSSEDQ